MRELTKKEQSEIIDACDTLRVLGFCGGLQPLYESIGRNQPQNIKNECDQFFSLKNFAKETEWKNYFDLHTKIFNAITDDSKTPVFCGSSQPEKISLAESGLVTITMTTCKRLELFNRTMRSFIECCGDISEHVEEWIVVDDNSSASDRAEMKRLWPFITLVEKGEADKGHPRSMNIILEKVRTPYILHIEDDWEFFSTDMWIGKMLKILNSNPSYGQVLFNLNYAEDSNVSSTISGSIFKAEPASYFVHRHLPPEKIAVESKKFRHNCFYWPHFSLRPGLWKTDLIKGLGKFSETAAHFEMEFAQKYNSAGYQTAFLPLIVSNHIGKRTYEKNKPNAYDLNNQEQFTKNKLDQPQKQKHGSNQLHIDTYVINLKRRPERLINFVKTNNSELPNFKVFEGVDGSCLEKSFAVHSLFSTGDFNFRRGIIGCALSHIEIWKKLVRDAGSDYTLVFEDDAKLAPGFIPKLLHLIENYKGGFDLLFLHWLPYPAFRNLDDFVLTKIPTARRWTREECCQRSMGGATAYLINRTAAMHLLQHIDSRGVYNGIDWVMFKCADEIRVMYSTPMLAFAECVQTHGSVDSDIQRDFSSCKIGDIDEFETDWWLKRLGEVPVSVESPDDPILLEKVCKMASAKTDLPRDKPWIWYKGKNFTFTVPWKFADSDFLAGHPIFDHKLWKIE